jgi:hypothetical protein
LRGRERKHRRVVGLLVLRGCVVEDGVVQEGLQRGPGEAVVWALEVVARLLCRRLAGPDVRLGGVVRPGLVLVHLLDF